jgi:3-deoxy-D-manno-octulosonic acid kinase
VASFGAFVELRQRGAVGWVREDLAPLGLAPFWGDLSPMAQAKGRGGVGLLAIGDVQLVVRPYLRGGALGALLRDRYPGPARARAELATLAALRQQGVPVVAPVAAVAQRSGAFWRLRLCTELVADALPVPAFLAAHPEARRFVADAVGTVVRLAFAAGLRHPDLHLDNVLCASRGEKVRAVLVDLDRAVLRAPLSSDDRDEMLVRMQRHLVRHRGDLAALPSRGETMRFLRALGMPIPDRHEAWRALLAKLQRSLRRRGLLRRVVPHFGKTDGTR